MMLHNYEYSTAFSHSWTALRIPVRKNAFLWSRCIKINTEVYAPNDTVSFEVFLRLKQKRSTRNLKLSFTKKNVFHNWQLKDISHVQRHTTGI